MVNTRLGILVWANRRDFIVLSNLYTEIIQTKNRDLTRQPECCVYRKP
jgi:hypothetical protein